MVKHDIHQFIGMQQDIKSADTSTKFIYEGNNIQITSQGDGSLLHISNEKGNTLMGDIEINGIYLGHCILNDYLVVFTAGIRTISIPNSNPSKDTSITTKSTDYIYRINIPSNECIVLFEGNLNFKINNPIETLGIYENENIQKVYWTDGINQPRVINIMSPDPKSFTTTSFDFVQDLKLQENITIEKEESSSGKFLSGVIQYAFTYYNKYGQESNIFHISPLYYTSPNDRAGSPEENISNSFKISIKNLDTRFNYLRVYSIHRTSIDSQPTVKIVGDYLVYNDIEEIPSSETTKYLTSYQISNIVNPFEYKDKIIFDSSLEEELKKYTVYYLGIDEGTSLSLYDLLTVSQEGLPKYDIVKQNNTNYIRLDISKFPNFTIKTPKGDYNNSEYVKLFRGTGGRNNALFLGPSVPKPSIHPDEVIQVPSGFYIHSSLGMLGTSLAVSTVIPKKVLEHPLVITDTNTTGETLDPTVLFYVGGEEIIAGTLAQKDYTLFLGDIKLKRQSVDIELNNVFSEPTTKYRNITIDKSTKGYYNHYNTLNLENTAGFKCGEYYRLGIQFQHATGKWSEPIFIKDYKVDIRPNLTESELQIPEIEVLIENKDIVSLDGTETDLYSYVDALGYKKVRPVAVFPEIHDREVLVQGMLCPTVYNIGNRLTNAPFAQSSWFIRPNIPDDNLNNTNNIDNGAAVEFKHNHGLLLGDNRGAEIQGIGGFKNDEVGTSYDLSYLLLNNVDFIAKQNTFTSVTSSEWFSPFYMVDQSIVTMHSPDIEWDSNIQNLSDKNYKLRIVGIINFTASIGDIDIQTSTPTIDAESTGFIHKTLGSLNMSNLAGNSLVSGLFYKDYYVTKDSNNIYKSSKDSKGDKYESSWMVYPWHRSGSLNNDTNRPAESGTRSAVIKQKKISNLKFSESNTWLENPWSPNNGITPIKVFNDDQVSLTKLEATSSLLNTDINYFGNIDTLVFPKEYYYYGALSKPKEDSEDSEDAETNFNSMISPLLFQDSPKELYKTKDPIRIKYKSTPHIAFGLNFYSEGEGKESIYCQEILPTLDKALVSTTRPAWFNSISEEDYSSSIQPEENNYKRIIGRGKELNHNIAASGVYFWQVTEDEGDILYLGNYIGEWVKVSDSDLKVGELYKYDNSLYKLIIVGNKEGNNIYELRYYSSILDSSVFTENLIVRNSTKFKVQQSKISLKTKSNNPQYPYLFLAELYTDEENPNRFGGTSKKAIQNNIWVPVGDAVSIPSDSSTITLEYKYGDTWYQRYDCLKTYPFSPEDENQIVEIASFMCETRVNIDGRYDKNRGQLSNLNITPRNFNLLNTVYSQKDNFFKYRILDSDFYNLRSFPNTITWTKEKKLAEDIDTWTNITMASTLDLDGNKGRITSLNLWDNNIIAFQEKGISQIIFNAMEQISTTNGVPIEISNSKKVSGKRYISDHVGCNNKWSIVESPAGIYFVDNRTQDIYCFGKNFTNLTSDLNMRDWLLNYKELTPWTPGIKLRWIHKSGVNFTNFKTSYDRVNKQVYFINNDRCLRYSEVLGQFESFLDYQNTFSVFNIGNDTYSLYHTPVDISNVNNSIDWTTGLWKNNQLDTTNIYGIDRKFSIEVLSNQDPLNDKIFNNIEFRCATDSNIPFDTLQVSNDYQDTEEVPITYDRHRPSELKRKFRIWRTNIPRNKGTRDRIRNPWAKVKLSGISKKIELYDLDVQYFI